MPRYLYKGRNEMGAVKTGSIDAPDEGQARKVLNQRGIIEVNHIEEFGPSEGDELIAEADSTMPVGQMGSGYDESAPALEPTLSSPPRRKGNPLVKLIVFLIIVGGLAAGGWYCYTHNLIPGLKSTPVPISTPLNRPPMQRPAPPSAPGAARPQAPAVATPRAATPAAHKAPGAKPK